MEDKLRLKYDPNNPPTEGYYLVWLRRKKEGDLVRVPAQFISDATALPDDYEKTEELIGGEVEYYQPINEREYVNWVRYHMVERVSIEGDGGE